MENSSKMTTLLFCVTGLTCAFNLIWEYQFSFMKLQVFLVLCIFIIDFIFFPNSWFCIGDIDWIGYIYSDDGSIVSTCSKLYCIFA